MVRIVALSLSLLILGATSSPASAQALGSGFTVTYKSPPAPKLRLRSLDGQEHDLSAMKGRLVYEAEGGRDMNSEHIRDVLQKLIDE